MLPLQDVLFQRLAEASVQRDASVSFVAVAISAIEAASRSALPTTSVQRQQLVA